MGAAAARCCAVRRPPKLRAGCYAAWKPDMDVYLARIGADGVHKRAMSATDWQKHGGQAGAVEAPRRRRSSWRTSASAADSVSGSSSSSDSAGAPS